MTGEVILAGVAIGLGMFLLERRRRRSFREYVDRKRPATKGEAVAERWREVPFPPVYQQKPTPPPPPPVRTGVLLRTRAGRPHDDGSDFGAFAAGMMIGNAMSSDPEPCPSHDAGNDGGCSE